MRKLILLFALMLIVPSVIFAVPHCQILLPVLTLNSNQIKDEFSELTSNYGSSTFAVKSAYSQGVSLLYVGESGLGIGLSQLSHKLAFDRSSLSGDNASVTDVRSHTSLEISLTLGESYSITIGAGIPISGYMQRDYNSNSQTRGSLSYGTIEGMTSFVTLGLGLFQKGSLLFGLRMSNMKYKPDAGSYQAEQNVITNAMIGYAIPFGG